jgi:hypothetical protein
MQAVALTPTTSNSKDDIGNMTAYKNRNAAGMKATAGPPTQ